MLGLGSFLARHSDTHVLFAFGRNKHFISRVGAARRHQNRLRKDCRAGCELYAAAGPWNPSTRGDVLHLTGHGYPGQRRDMGEAYFRLTRAKGRGPKIPPSE